MQQQCDAQEPIPNFDFFGCLDSEAMGRVSEMCFTLGGTFSPMAINRKLVRCGFCYDLIKIHLGRHGFSWAPSLHRVSPKTLRWRCVSANPEPPTPSLDAPIYPHSSFAHVATYWPASLPFRAL